MRPNAVESLRGIQAALMQSIVPELQTAFAQDVAQVTQMLIESLVNEWDTAVENLHKDNQAIAGLLSRFGDALNPLAGRNDGAGALVKEIDAVLGDPGDGSLAVSRLTERNDRLRDVLERVLTLCEDVAGEPGLDALMQVRRDAYNNLRRVAARGWSVFDLLSFREKMAEVRANPEFA